MASSENTKRGEGERRLCAPRLACPKGGRAIRDISKKLVSNLVTGTGSLTVPITTSSERAGFDPQLALSCDLSVGNSLFGFGWDFFLPAIRRKTDKDAAVSRKRPKEAMTCQTKHRS